MQPTEIIFLEENQQLGGVSGGLGGVSGGLYVCYLGL